MQSDKFDQICPPITNSHSGCDEVLGMTRLGSHREVGQRFGPPVWVGDGVGDRFGLVVVAGSANP
jgi:hypothetical protein